MWQMFSLFVYSIITHELQVWTSCKLQLELHSRVSGLFGVSLFSVFFPLFDPWLFISWFLFLSLIYGKKW